MIGRAPSSASFLSISHTSGLRFPGSDSVDCRSEQLFELGITISGVVARRTAAIVLVELLVRSVDTAAGEIEPDLIVLAHDLGEPDGSLDNLKFTVDEHFL